jgi:hypothetical protein
MLILTKIEKAAKVFRLLVASIQKDTCLGSWATESPSALLDIFR